MTVLFLCVANSARSQMAEGLASHLLGDGVRVQSAGSNPTSVHPLAVQVMAEIGIDISRQTAKSVETIDPAAVDVIVSLCAENVCPAAFGAAARWHWPLPDPAAGGGSIEEQLRRFRDVRDDIARRLTEVARQVKGTGEGGRVREA